MWILILVWSCKAKIWSNCKMMVKKTDDICKDIAEVVDTRFDTSSHELEDPYLKEKMKK